MGADRLEDLVDVETAAGVFTARREGDLVRATGIRYARAERFRPAVAEAVAAEPVPATSLSPACPQNPTPLLDDLLVDAMGELTVDEDCLRLSVTAPADADGLPVMVFLHGGSYRAGAGDSPVFDPRALVREQRVVVVAVTYRLGLLGYLGDGTARSANLGLLDQVEALRWVQRAIAGFGGDPGCVTVFGHSAGGDAVAHLMIADGARGLFSRAIVQSAPLGISRGRARMSAAMDVAAGELDAGTPLARAARRRGPRRGRGRPVRPGRRDAVRHPLRRRTAAGRGRPGRGLGRRRPPGRPADRRHVAGGRAVPARAGRHPGRPVRPGAGAARRRTAAQPRRGGRSPAGRSTAAPSGPSRVGTPPAVAGPRPTGWTGARRAARTGPRTASTCRCCSPTRPPGAVPR